MAITCVGGGSPQAAAGAFDAFGEAQEAGAIRQLRHLHAHLAGGGEGAVHDPARAGLPP
jgi:hypothetical protein